MPNCDEHHGQFDRPCCGGKGFMMTNYLYQAAVAVEMMEEWLADSPEYREEWEAWDWL